MVKRNALRYLVDALLYVFLCSISVVGLLLGFVIPRGRQPGERLLWGLHRHQWGDIHLVFSLLLLVMVVVHLWLNWRWVVQISRRLFSERWRGALLLFSAAWVPVLFFAWLLARL